MSQNLATNANLTIIGVSVYDLNEHHSADARANIVPLGQTISDLRESKADWQFSKGLLSQYPLALVRRLAECGLTTIYLSSLSWMEFCHVVTRKRFRDGLEPEVQAQFRLTLWDDEESVRRNYLGVLLEDLNALLEQFEWNEISVTPAVRQVASELVASYRLDGQDATHVACAMEAGVLDLASFDEGFLRVDGLHVWTEI